MEEEKDNSDPEYSDKEIQESSGSTDTDQPSEEGMSDEEGYNSEEEDLEYEFEEYEDEDEDGEDYYIIEDKSDVKVSQGDIESKYQYDAGDYIEKEDSDEDFENRLEEELEEVGIYDEDQSEEQSEEEIEEQSEEEIEEQFEEEIEEQSEEEIEEQSEEEYEEIIEEEPRIELSADMIQSPILKSKPKSLPSPQVTSISTKPKSIKSGSIKITSKSAIVKRTAAPPRINRPKKSALKPGEKEIDIFKRIQKKQQNRKIRVSMSAKNLAEQSKILYQYNLSVAKKNRQLAYSMEKKIDLLKKMMQVMEIFVDKYGKRMVREVILEISKEME